MPADPTAADLSQAQRLDALADRFEAAWRAGRAPRIEDYVAEAPPGDRAALLRQLFELEFELTQGAGATLHIEELRRRFPKDGQLLREALVRFAPLQASIDTSVAQDGTQESTRDGRESGSLADALREPADPSLPARIGRFEVRGLLGAGAFGKVYRAADPSLGRDVAIKVPLADAIRSAGEKERFLREARAAATLQHPNLCPVYEVGEADGAPFIVMALVPGQSLAELLKNRREPLSPRQVGQIVRKLALALEAAHRKGIVHRDLKPGNIMFDRDRKDVVIMDFGLARAPTKDDATATQSGVIMGTPAYMSPEQARGQAKSVGPAADIYSLGVILYELLTGARPFNGTVAEVLGKILHVAPPPPSAVRPGVDARLEAVCLKAMAKEPEQRYGSMRELAAAVDAALKAAAAGDAAAAAAAGRPTDGAEHRPLEELFAAPSLARRTATVIEALPTRARTPRWIFVALGLLLLAGVVTLGIIFLARTPTATLVIHVDVDLKDPSLRFILDDKPISGEALAQPVELKVGEHELAVWRGETLVKRMLFSVRGGGNPTIEVKDVQTPKPPASAPIPPPAAGPPPPTNPWIPLFNGKDLTGWDGAPDFLALWRVQDGMLQGSGKGQGKLLGPDVKLSDFTLRVEYQCDPGGASAVFLSLPRQNQFVRVKIRHPAPGDSPEPRLLTGSLNVDGGKEFPAAAWWCHTAPRLKPFPEWNLLDITLADGLMKVDVNEREVYRRHARDLPPFRGVVGSSIGVIAYFQPDAKVRYRTVAYRKATALPEGIPPELAALRTEGGFTPLFDGKSTVGWKAVDGPVLWRTSAGVLASAGPKHVLFSERGDYADIHVRAEARINDGGDAGIVLRAPLVKDLVPPGYESRITTYVQSPGKIGSLYFIRPGAKPADWLVQGTEDSAAAAGEWFVLEMLARGPRVWTLVNGRVTADYADPDHTYRQGHIGLLHGGGKSRVEFRKLEVKELPVESPPEPAWRASEGFVPLFNGKDLAGWKIDGGDPKDWRVENGTIVAAAPGRDSKESWLLTERSFGDFVARFQYLAEPPRVNSGFALRAVPGEKALGAKGDAPYPAHVQVEIFGQYDKARELQTGSVFGGLAPLTSLPADPAEQQKPFGQWNQMEIELRGQAIRVRLNGQAILDGSLDDLAARGGVLPGLKRSSGRVGFQRFNGSARFRNIEIKELPPASAAAESAGFVPLFNGKDLAGWQVHPSGVGAWKVKDGAIVGSGPASHLFTKQDDFADFHLRVEAKVNARGNSGVYFRSPFMAGYPKGYEAQICALAGDAIKTGSLYPSFSAALSEAERKALIVRESLHGDNAWFVLEVIAQGERIVIRVNGRTTVDFVDSKRSFASGRFALQQHDPGSEVMFRKIEVKRLAPGEAALPPASPGGGK